MESTTFDHITKLFSARRKRRSAIAGGLSLARISPILAGRHSRRAALRGGAVGLAAATVAAPFARRLAAQDATPAATPEVTTSTDPHPNADAPAKTEMLFVQPFAGGAWAPKAGDDGVYTLTLTGAAANTVYFSDRPERIFGLSPTQRFLDGLGFTPANPPNAALVARPAAGEDEDVLVIELLNPVYDAAAGTLTYDARVLADYAGEGLKGAGRQQADYEFPEQFGEGGLFIDSCPDGAGTCSKIVNGQKHDIGPIQDVGYCWSLKLPDVNYDCYPCNNDGKSWYYGHLCAKNFPDHCSYTCNATGCSWDCYVFDVNTSDF